MPSAPGREDLAKGNFDELVAPAVGRRCSPLYLTIVTKLTHLYKNVSYCV